MPKEGVRVKSGEPSQAQAVEYNPRVGAAWSDLPRNVQDALDEARMQADLFDGSFSGERRDLRVRQRAPGDQELPYRKLCNNRLCGCHIRRLLGPPADQQLPSKEQLGRN